MQEFDLISQVFAPLAGDDAPANGLKDDTACLQPPEGRDLIFTKDLMIENVHFPSNAQPSAVARRLLRVNLSDLAAAGAQPMGYMLGVAATGDEDEAWFQDFASGLKADQEEFGVRLWGGDTTSGSTSLCLSLTAVGSVPKGSGLKRTGAEVGDGIYVTGTIGDAAFGLKALEGKLVERVLKNDADYFTDRYWRPRPRLSIGQGLLGVASAAVDVSDGLLADVEHLASASALKAVVETKLVPLSASLKAYVKMDPSYVNEVVSGGDDYELVFTAPRGTERQIIDIGWRAGVLITRIGDMDKGEGLSVLDLEGQAMNAGQKGYQHLIGNKGN